MNILKRLSGPFRTKKREERTSFSVADLYNIVTPTDHLIMGLVGTKENIFAFRTKESTFFKTRIAFFGQNAFASYYSRKFGFNVDQEGYLQEMESNTQENYWRLNLAMAEEFKILLYKGDVNQDLIKVSPS